ncbi:MAG: hypothetical protein KAV82_15660 [Phycisphaerae bacterium]|nr:hypothetical protein [Phycisphaerae bacterium]
MGSKCKLQSGGVLTDSRRYPQSAYAFVLEGLEYAVEKVHGPLTPPQSLVGHYMAKESIDLQEMIERHEDGVLDAVICKAIEEAGGFEGLNRHVSGADLCWALRSYARRRWGLLAREVLRLWGITRTGDFGNVVFDLIESSRLQREPHDRLEDFNNVFDFKEAFDETFRFTLLD